MAASIGFHLSSAPGEREHGTGQRESVSAPQVNSARRRQQHGRQEAGQRGFSMFELVVAIVVVLALGMVFLDRVQEYQELAEKTAAETTAINMRTGLRFRVLEMLVRQQDREIAALVGSNPIKWLELPLLNYAGEFHQAQADRVPPGNWYFELDTGEIRYRVQRRRHFVPGPSGLPELRYRVAASFRRTGADGSVTLAEGVNLIQLEKYRWIYAEKDIVLP